MKCSYCTKTCPDTMGFDEGDTICETCGANLMTIKELIKQSHDTAKEKGWWDDPRTFGENIALCHSELSEAYEEFRNYSKFTEIYYNDGNSKPEGIPIEIADVLIRIGDLCGRYNIDLESAVELKLEYNKTRPYRHGNKKN